MLPCRCLDFVEMRTVSVTYGCGFGIRWWSKNTVAVVTGSNKGLGRAIVLELARNGVTVVSTARDTARGLAAVESQVKAEPELKDLIHFHPLDVTVEKSVTQLASYLQNNYGGVDILVSIFGSSPTN